jgi:L-2,4-diaminobutyric acid acetyltransferase
MVEKRKDEEWIFRQPRHQDGQDIHQLIELCPPLDQNSAYCNFLQSAHFSDTCIVAEYKNEVVGFISAYRKPRCNTDLFVWQVAVHPKARRIGLAFHMLTQLLERENMKHITAVETTITEGNRGSWRLFEKLDASNKSEGKVTTFLDEAEHFQGDHETEYLFRIPLNSQQ